MAREIDVYQLLRAFAHRNRLSEIGYRAFADAVQRQARLSDPAEPVFRDLALNPDLVLVPKLFLLAKDKKISLQTLGNEIGSIQLPEHYTEVFFQEYRRIDENPDIPFPDEDSLKTLVPQEWIKSVSLESDLGAASDAGGEKAVSLARITFPEGLRPLVIPSAFIPDKLLEYALLKIRQYLRRGANKDYMLNKLLSAFPGKEMQLKDALTAILTRPFDAAAGLRRSNTELTYPLWAYLVSAIKKDLEKKGDRTAEDQAVQQAAFLCEFYASHYRGKAQRIVEVELAQKALDASIRKAPYSYTIEEIEAFHDAKGVPIVAKIGREQLEGRLHAKTTRAEQGALPELLVLSAGGRRVYMATDRTLHLLVRLLGEARADIRARLIEQWRRLMEDFRSTPSMVADDAFRKELETQVAARFPLVEALVSSRLLPVIYGEQAAKAELPPDLDRLFYKGDLVPLEELIGLTRKALAADVRMLLPFWYSVPILSGLARILRRLGRGPSDKPAERKAAAKIVAARPEDAPPRQPSARGQTAAQRRAEFAAAGRKIAQSLLPSGYSLDEYLRELESHWNTLLGAEAKANLREDVESLARDYLRGVLRSMRGETFSPERVKNLAATLADSPNLLKIKNHQALELYIQLYMAKVIGADARSV
ncbi:MAG TPA: hypothetical protein VMV90_10775 [Rectinemataceae bacterium]|nr:hypothetical protein [Rectinemataceae bacterium]